MMNSGTLVLHLSGTFSILEGRRFPSTCQQFSKCRADMKVCSTVPCATSCCKLYIPHNPISAACANKHDVYGSLNMRQVSYTAQTALDSIHHGGSNDFNDHATPCLAPYQWYYGDTESGRLAPKIAMLRVRVCTPLY